MLKEVLYYVMFIIFGFSLLLFFNPIGLSHCKAAFTLTRVQVTGIRERVIVNANLHVFQWQRSH